MMYPFPPSILLSTLGSKRPPSKLVHLCGVAGDGPAPLRYGVVSRLVRLMVQLEHNFCGAQV